MSADNFRTCPVCERNRQAKIVELKGMQADVYDTQPEYKYLQLLRDINDLETASLGDTLSECGTIVGIEYNGDLYIDYKAECDVCKTVFKMEEWLPTAFSEKKEK